MKIADVPIGAPVLYKEDPGTQYIVLNKGNTEWQVRNATTDVIMTLPLTSLSVPATAEKVEPVPAQSVTPAPDTQEANPSPDPPTTGDGEDAGGYSQEAEAVVVEAAKEEADTTMRNLLIGAAIIGVVIYLK